MVVYFGWRLFFTFPTKYGPVAIVCAVILFVCEFVSAVEAFIHLLSSMNPVVPERPTIPKEWYPDVDVFIATHNESTDVLYKTVNGCKYMKYPDKSKVHIWICDDGYRMEVKELAEKMGVGWQGLQNNKLAKAGNLNNALAHTSAPLVVTFDADMIPTRNFLLETVPYFFLPRMKKLENGKWVERTKDEIDPNYKIGFIQTPQNFYNPDLFQYNLYAEDKVPNEQDYFFREINVSRNKSNSPIYAGSNTVISRKALEGVEFYSKYPKNVEEAAEKIDAAITPEEIARREDFRDVFTCTIDPKDAKDFDDALSIRKTDKGLWEVGVHIADVSHYVKEGSTIDKEAYARATSIYLVDRTIPMLPERLCNFICSLRPDEEKLCYSVIFKMDDEANIKDWHLAHTVIKSDRRYAYEEVQQIIEEGKGENAEFLLKLDALAKKLREARFKNGSVKFDREELHFDIDETGKPIRAYFKVSKDANKLIEEFMLLANKTVAESIGRVKKGVKAKTLPYRIHDQPDPQKLENLREFVAKFGYKVKTAGTKGAITKSLNALMSQAEGTREQNAIETVALRAMMKAKYSVHNIGHYGLAFDYYTHFTSPIRRYPDMMVHRLLTKYQDGARSANKDKYEEFCEHCSDMEQISMNAERDSIKYKMVEFMADKIGNTYDAHISGIQSYGIYAQIDETHCEGMIPIRDLGNDYYDFDEKNYMSRE